MNRISRSWKAGYGKDDTGNIVEQYASNSGSDSCDELEDVRNQPAT